MPAIAHPLDLTNEPGSARVALRRIAGRDLPASATSHDPDLPHRLRGDTPVMQRLREQIARVAPRNVTVLVQGETGTGKELVARALHAGGPRRDRPFVAVNCAELSPDAAESRLFGHRKGSFTGAIDEHRGFFEAADGGTLFLDEVGELLLLLQSKLLRALQEGEITRFGDNRPRSVDVRIVAATNRNLAVELGAGRFRADLLSRLNVVPIRVPALRDRLDDVPALAVHLLKLHAGKLGIPVPLLTAGAQDALRARAYPGNVRDLENLVVRALVFAEPGRAITAAHLRDLDVPSCEPVASRADGARAAGALDPGDSLAAAVASFERAQITRALRVSNGNRVQAARALKISYRWLLKKLERYETDEEDGDAAPSPT